ncbi:MAG: TIGR01841 family phasin, partial [Proteobacteria bacterium]|nr:TIGR01841 family phasin [Pseudomonadota bacterium]
GYQDLYKRQVALFEAAVAETKDKLAQVQGQPLTADQATQSVDALKAAFEKAAADVKELAELAQKANTGAFEIVKVRAEEAVAEFKTAAAKAAV